MEFITPKIVEPLLRTGTQPAYSIVKLTQPSDSAFFVGESVIGRGDHKTYTVCDITDRQSGWYGLWREGVMSGYPTHHAHDTDLLHVYDYSSHNE